MNTIEQAQATPGGPKDIVFANGTGFTELRGVKIHTDLDQEAWGVMQAGSISLADYEAIARAM